jgi:putative peptidoglycan lipid II flippase
VTDNKTDNKESPQQPSFDHTELVSQPKRGLLGSSFIVSVGTMLSRVLGLARDVVLANLLGAAPNADAFFVAFKIPNFLRRLFAEGAFSQAFVPVLTETRERGSHEAVRHLVDRVAGVLGGSLFVLTALAMVMAPWVALIFAPGFSRDAAKLALTGRSDCLDLSLPTAHQPAPGFAEPFSTATGVLLCLRTRLCC